nr:hypothetical protein [uncultured Mediterranean phage uvMED]
MKIELTRECVIGSGRYKSGTILQLDDDVANGLVDSGRAVPVDVKVKQDNRSIGLDDDKPRTRAKK